jgi:hypothetical protein
LLAQGIKPVENMPTTDWVSWGCQGYIIFVNYQGASVLENFQEFLPEAYHDYEYSEENKGKLLSMHIMSAPDSPCRPNDAGWVGSSTPRGSPSVMLRVETTIHFKSPITPTKPYRLGGGLMLLHDPDVELIIIELCKMIISDPTHILGTQIVSKAVDIFGLEASLDSLMRLKRLLEAKRTPITGYEISYPAHYELLRTETNTLSIYRVDRKVIKIDNYRVLATQHIYESECDPDFLSKIWLKEGVVFHRLLSWVLGFPEVDRHREWPGLIYIQVDGGIALRRRAYPAPIPIYSSWALPITTGGMAPMVFKGNRPSSNEIRRKIDAYRSQKADSGSNQASDRLGKVMSGPSPILEAKATAKPMVPAAKPMVPAGPSMVPVDPKKVPTMVEKPQKEVGMPRICLSNIPGPLPAQGGPESRILYVHLPQKTPMVPFSEAMVPGDLFPAPGGASDPSRSEEKVLGVFPAQNSAGIGPGEPEGAQNDEKNAENAQKHRFMVPMGAAMVPDGPPMVPIGPQNLSPTLPS